MHGDLKNCKFKVLTRSQQDIKLSEIFVNGRFNPCDDKFHLDNEYNNISLHNTLKLKDIVFESGEIKSYTPPKEIQTIEKLIKRIRLGKDRKNASLDKELPLTGGENYLFNKTQQRLKNLTPSFIFGLVIPDRFKGETVTSIAEGVFAMKNLINLQLPNSLKKIGKVAFYDNKIVSVNIPNGTEKLECYAFSRNKLRNVKLPQSVNYIGEYAFTNNLLEKLTLSPKITIIPPYCFAGNKLRKVKIPTMVDSIMESAFRGSEIEELYFNTKLVYIGKEAFQANHIEKLDFPKSLEYIGTSAFRSNPLVSIKLPNTPVSVNEYAFRSFFDGLPSYSVEIKKGSTIGKYAFDKGVKIIYK